MKMLWRTSRLVFSFIFLCITLTRCDDAGFQFIVSPAAPELPVLEGGPVELTCAVSRSAPIRWTLNGAVIASTARRLVTQTSPNSSRLRITRVDRVADGGAVRCEVDSISGSNNIVESPATQLDITWLSHPVVNLESPSDISGVEKVNDVTLFCDVDVGPGEIQYHWYRNADHVSSLNTHNFDIKKKRLHIKQATAKDNGVYRCNVQLDNETKESKKSFVLSLVDPSLPQVRVHPEDVLLPPKSTAFFHCQFKSSDVVKWIMNNITINENNPRAIFHENGTLELRNVTRKDEGFYTCGIANKKAEKGLLQGYSAKLRVAHLPLIRIQDFEPVISETRVVHAQMNSAFRLTCLSSKETTPPSLVMWKNTENHLISDKGDVKVDDGTLVIEKVLLKYQGVYNCVQENIAGTQAISVFIVVDPTPKITKNPLNIEVDENDQCNLKCGIIGDRQENLYFDLKKFWNKIVDSSYLGILHGKQQHSKNHGRDKSFMNVAGFGNNDNSEVKTVESYRGMNKDQIVQMWLDDFNLQLFDVFWKKDGRVIKEDEGHVKLSRNGENQILKFETTFSSDRGQYWCEAVTSAGKVVSSSAANLIVREKLRFSPPPVNKKLELNSAGKVHCKAQGTPLPTVSWYKWLDSPLPDDVSSVNGTLLFTKVNKDHMANYTCVAMNDQGTIQTTIVIDVVVSPRFISPQPSEQIDVSEGDPVWLHCIVEGDPIPKTQWDKSLKSIDSRETIVFLDNGTEIERISQLDNGTLHIRFARLEDSDHYGCTAGNSAGLKREEVVLVVHTPGEMIGLENEDGLITKAVLITMSVVGAYILLVVGLVLWCKIRRRRKLAELMETEKLENGDIELKDKEDRDKEHDKLIENIQEGENEATAVSRKNKSNGNAGPKPKNGSIANRSGNSAANSGDGSEVSKKSGQGGAYDKLIIDKDFLGNFVSLGRGEFGEVFTAVLENDAILPEENYRGVMVKSLQQSAQKDESLLAEFKRQLDCFSKLRHDNLSSVIGLCNQSQPHYMIFQYTDWGDLKQFLLATRTPDEVVAQSKGEPCKVENRTGCNALNLTQQLSVASHIARGMEAIADSRIVHKDLATRNCLLTSRLSVKISLPSLTKDVYSKEYCKHVNQVIPLRWLPAECVYDSDYSTKSDVYMFACTLWEIFHKGELPFIKMNDSSVLNHMKANTLKYKAHPDMPEALVELLNQCWDVSPKNRPTFNDITRQLNKIFMDVKELEISHAEG